MSDVSKFLDSVSGGKYNTGIGLLPSVDISPIVGLNGYDTSSKQYTDSNISQDSLNQLSGVSYSGTSNNSSSLSNLGPSSSLLGSLGGGNTGYDSNSGTSFSNPAGSNNKAINNVISGLGMLGNVTNDPNLKQLAGIAGAGYNALNGNYTGLGGYMGGMLSGSPYGSLLGALAGNYLSPETSTTKFAANALLGLGVPGYGLINAATGGWFGNNLFGTDAQKNEFGQTTISAQPGLFGNLGWNNDNRNTTQQDFRKSEINDQNNDYGGGSTTGQGNRNGMNSSGGSAHAGGGSDPG